MAVGSGDQGGGKPLSLVCLQRYVNPPGYPVLRVRVAHKLCLNLLENSTAGAGPLGAQSYQETNSCPLLATCFG